jgi:hypothetical protein
VTPDTAAQFIAVQYGALGQWKSIRAYAGALAIAYARAVECSNHRGELDAAKALLDAYQREAKVRS